MISSPRKKKRLKIQGYTPIASRYLPPRNGQRPFVPSLRSLPFSPSFLCRRYRGCGPGTLPWARLWARVQGKPNGFLSCGSLFICFLFLFSFLGPFYVVRVAWGVFWGCVLARLRRLYLVIVLPVTLIVGSIPSPLQGRS